MKKTRIFPFKILIKLFIFFFPLGIFAQTLDPKEEVKLFGQGITMSPVTFELTADPGDTLSNLVKITNPGGNPIGVKMEVEDFVAVGEAGKVAVLETENDTYSLKKWISADPQYFTLAPDESKMVAFTIAVPKNAEPGGHYASVLSVISAESSPGSGSAIAQKVGALVLLSVSGEIKENLLVREFSAPRFQEYGPVPFVIRFENSGSIHIRPIGFISVTNFWGKKLADIPFPQKNVLPGAIRKLDAEWNKKYLFGKYNADLIGSYGTNINNAPLFASLSFWVIPWRISSAILAALLAISYILYRGRKRIFLALRILIRGR